MDGWTLKPTLLGRPKNCANAKLYRVVLNTKYVIEVYKAKCHLTVVALTVLWMVGAEYLCHVRVFSALCLVVGKLRLQFFMHFNERWAKWSHITATRQLHLLLHNTKHLTYTQCSDKLRVHAQSLSAEKTTATFCCTEPLHASFNGCRWSRLWLLIWSLVSWQVPAHDADSLRCTALATGDLQTYRDSWVQDGYANVQLNSGTGRSYFNHVCVLVLAMIPGQASPH